MTTALIKYALQTICHGFQQLPELLNIYMVTFVIDSRVTMESSVFWTDCTVQTKFFGKVQDSRNID